MAKKKAKTIYNIEEVNLEIDYEKLAQAVVNAQQKAAQKTTRPNRFRGTIMGALNMSLYLMLAFLSVGMVIGVWTTPIGGTISQVFFSVLFVIIGIFSGGCAVESFKDSDENAQQHFNTNITLIALVVALAALVKG